MKDRRIKPHYKTKIWLTINGKKVFYYLEEHLDMIRFKNSLLK